MNRGGVCLEETAYMPTGLAYVEPSINSNVHDGKTGLPLVKQHGNVLQLAHDISIQQLSTVVNL